MYELLSGVPPFPDKPTLPEYFRQMRKARVVFPSRFWSNISTEAKELITLLLEKDPKKRYSAAEVLKHPWITENCQFEDHVSMMESNANLGSYNLGKERPMRLKIILEKEKINRVLYYLILMGRLRRYMDQLLKATTGSGADHSLGDLVKASVGCRSPTKKNEDFRRFSQVLKEKAFGEHGDKKEAKKNEYCLAMTNVYFQLMAITIMVNIIMRQCSNGAATASHTTPTAFYASIPLNRPESITAPSGIFNLARA
ncbi:hypothetical protein AAMO2058_000661800 [Amorphochlora amoebiformis]